MTRPEDLALSLGIVAVADGDSRIAIFEAWLELTGALYCALRHENGACACR